METGRGIKRCRQNGKASKEEVVLPDISHFMGKKGHFTG